MSTSELIEQINVLPKQDIRPVATALRVRRVEAARETADHGSVRDGFEAVVQKVFTTHEELLAKLAK